MVTTTMSGICLLLVSIFGCIHSSPLAPPFSGACGPSQRCIGGAICVSNICKCPPVPLPAAGPCLYAEPPRPLPMPVAHPYPAPYGFFPEPVGHHRGPFAPAPIPAPLHPRIMPAPIPAAVPVGGPAPAPFALPIPHPGPAPFAFAAPALWNGLFAAHAALAAPFPFEGPAGPFHGPAPIAAPAPMAPLPGPAPIAAPFPEPFPGRLGPALSPYAWPGANCAQGRLCLGNSFCQQGTCGCPTNFVYSGHSCLEPGLAPGPPVLPAAPAPYAFPHPGPAPAPIAAPVPFFAGAHFGNFAPAAPAFVGHPVPQPFYAAAPAPPAPLLPAAPRAAIMPHNAAVMAVHAAPAPLPLDPGFGFGGHFAGAPGFGQFGVGPVASHLFAPGPQPGHALASLLAHPHAAPFPFPFSPFTLKSKKS